MITTVAHPKMGTSSLPLAAVLLDPEDRDHQLAGFFCLLGFFLHTVLADLLLNAVGFNYASETGKFYEKFHPGTYFIFIGFFLLLLEQGNPFRMFGRLWLNFPASISLFLLIIMLFAYVVVRSGSGGTAFLVDTHMAAVLCAAVVACAPPRYCRTTIHVFVIIACINSLMGIVEGIWQFRIFNFDPTAPGMTETIFRASAMRGHPLNNAMFTSIALFVTLALRYPVYVKLILAGLFLVSLVAFGGRAGLGFTVFGALVYGCLALKGVIVSGRLTMPQFFLLVLGVVLLPVLMLLGLQYLVLYTDMGARLAASSLTDSSANSRLLVLTIFEYLSPFDVAFGVSADHITEVAYRMNLMIPLADIENPWILMLLGLGAFGFAIWFPALLVFIWSLMRGKPLALQFAVMSYFIIASTSNSFGRKDSTFIIMVCAVVAAARSLRSQADIDVGEAKIQSESSRIIEAQR